MTGHPSHPDQLMAQALGVCWHSPGLSALWPCAPLADWERELLQKERVARALYAYDNGGGVPFDQASPDTLAPYYDMAEIALEAAA